MQNIELRDYFAGQVIAGVMGTQPGRQWERERETAEFAEKAYAIADAMLAARNKGEPVKPATSGAVQTSVKIGPGA